MSQAYPPGGSPPPEPPYVTAEAVTPGPYPPPPPSSRSSGKVLLFVFGGLGVACLLCCGTCSGLGLWTVQNEHRETAQKIISEYANHPVVVEQLGGIDSCKGNLLAGLDDSQHDMVFDVHGPLGSGTVHVETFIGQMITVVLRKDDKEWDLMGKISQADEAL
jgi:hypothetical protein